MPRVTEFGEGKRRGVPPKNFDVLTVADVCRRSLRPTLATEIPGVRMREKLSSNLEPHSVILRPDHASPRPGTVATERRHLTGPAKSTAAKAARTPRSRRL